MNLRREWHPTKNGTTTFDNCHASKNVWWKCSVADDHEWEACISKRRGRGDGCPFCSGHRACKSNSFGFLFPLLAQELHPTLNDDLDKFKVTIGSHKKVWWICPISHDHIWQTSIKQRTLRKTGCPCCDGKKVVNSNSLATVYPKLARQWNLSKNKKKPTEVYAGGHEKIWWTCHKGHEWKAAIKTRISGHGCPICNESKGENKIRDFLENKKITYFREYKFDNLKRERLLKFDFMIEINNSMMLIEYHGQQHYSNHVFFGGEKAYELRKTNDSLKIDYCQKNKIPLLVLPYWEYDNIENKLNKFIQKHLYSVSILC
jgi:hypothetical protein